MLYEIQSLFSEGIEKIGFPIEDFYAVIDEISWTKV
jgi:hypothetical protein